MSFAWSWGLVALALVPLLLLWRHLGRRRRRKAVVRVSSVAVARAASAPPGRWRRLPAVLLAGGLVLLGVAAARPQMRVTQPSDGTSILLAIDVSGSMCSTDVSPNRLTAAQKAASVFVRAQHGKRRIGIVAFSGEAGLLVAPTKDQDTLLDAIDGLTTSRGTAIGMAILAAIDATAEVNPAVAPTGDDLETGKDATTQPDAIVVLTDGANTTGVDPETAAQQAAARGLRVYTIGFGTERPSTMVCDASQGGANGSGPGGGFGPGSRGGSARIQQIDERVLTQVARTTGGEYHRAEDADQLTTALSDLPSTITVTRREVDASVWFAAVAAVLVLTGLGLALWRDRPRPRSSTL